jgi:hypothetical protein
MPGYSLTGTLESLALWIRAGARWHVATRDLSSAGCVAVCEWANEMPTQATEANLSANRCRPFLSLKGAIVTGGWARGSWTDVG